MRLPGVTSIVTMPFTGSPDANTGTAGPVDASPEIRLVGRTSLPAKFTVMRSPLPEPKPKRDCGARARARERRSRAGANPAPQARAHAP